jgi:hypothetical protein
MKRCVCSCRCTFKARFYFTVSTSLSLLYLIEPSSHSFSLSISFSLVLSPDNSYIYPPIRRFSLSVGLIYISFIMKVPLALLSSLLITSTLAAPIPHGGSSLKISPRLQIPLQLPIPQPHLEPQETAGISKASPRKSQPSNLNPNKKATPPIQSTTLQIGAGLSSNPLHRAKHLTPSPVPS